MSDFGFEMDERADVFDRLFDKIGPVDDMDDMDEDEIVDYVSDPSIPKDLISINDALAKKYCSRPTLYRRISSGDIRSYMRGSRRMISEKELDDLYLRAEVYDPSKRSYSIVLGSINRNIRNLSLEQRAELAGVLIGDVDGR